MRLGFSTMNGPDDVRPDVLARVLEDRGYDSLWVGEHSHIPASRATPYPSGGELPKAYIEMMDPFVSLTMAAMATKELKIGTGVCLALEHDILDLAKTVASLDLMSGGRMLFGVGVGWNEEELANHRPIPWKARYRGLEECVTALRNLWTEHDSEFHGEFYDFDAAWSFPKPLQQPTPPVLLGVGGKLGTEHAVRWADEWMPMDVALGNVAKNVGKFREASAAAGRGEIPITMVAFGNPSLDRLKEYRDLGVQRTILGAARVGWDDPATAMPMIDDYAPFVDQLL
ncbi:MAG: LLM class F420-dependent oxidoreductase [Actinomycetota bacterium]|nr:LLM class F420-dependent oxidoreductase [Actinomycetota bacterium]